jgi:hypothetical protein
VVDDIEGKVRQIFDVRGPLLRIALIEAAY